MPQIRVRIDGTAVNGWMATTSTEFPEAEFRMLATQLRDEGALVILEVLTSEGDAVVRRFENTPEVGSLEVLHRDEQSVLIQFVTTSSKSYDPLFRSKNVSVYPTILRDGWFSVRLVGPHERLSEYTAELAAAGIPYRVLSVTQSYESSELLTKRQWQFVTEAVERGYYDTPRGCTLTELADAFGVHKSTASRLCHRAESRIVKAFVSEA